MIEADNGYYVAKVVSLLDRDATDTKERVHCITERVTSISQFVRNGKRKRILKYIKKYGIRSVLLIRA